MWGMNNKEGRTPKNWCFQTMVLEKPLENPLESKEIKPVNLKVYQPWILFGRTDAKAEAPVLWPPDVNSWLTGKRCWCWERLTAEEEGDRGWDGWKASPIKWTWIWTNSGRWWGTGKPGMLQSMGSQRVRQDWATELNVVDYIKIEVYTVIIACLDYLIRRAFGLF